MRKLLLVDDDPIVHDTFKLLFKNTSIAVDCVDGGRQAVSLISKNPQEYPVVLMDYHLDGDTATITGSSKGSYFLKLIKNISPDIYVFMLSGDIQRETLKNSMKSGAKDFFEKDGDFEQTKNAVIAAFDKFEANNKTTDDIAVKEKNRALIEEVGMVGHSKAMAKVARDARDASGHSYTVLILGESGTGKELLASSMAKKFAGPFLPVNCAAYKDDLALMESELFGHEAGAFTGANKLKKGIFEMAAHGVVFLDEVHELSMPAQLKLFRVLQEKKIRRVGGTEEIALNKVKVIAAAKPTIREKVDSGEFYLDLYTRLCVFPIEIPTLKERPEDIPILVDFFCDKYCKENGLDKKFLVPTVEELKKRNWPGNVRELEHFVLRQVITSPSRVISPKDIMTPAHPGLSLEESISTITQLKEHSLRLEKDLIARTLQATASNQSMAAKQLGLPLSTLQLKLKKHGLFHHYSKRSDAGTSKRAEVAL